MDIKYDEQSLITAFNKLANPYIAKMRKKIANFLKTKNTTLRQCFYTDYKSRGQEWFEEYEVVVKGNHVYKMVYFYEYYDNNDLNTNDTDDIGKTKDEILKIINSEKCPFKFKGYCDSDREGSIGISIEIGELVKHTADIGVKEEITLKDATHIFEFILRKNYNHIARCLKQLTKGHEDTLTIPDRLFVSTFDDDGEKYITIRSLDMNVTNKTWDYWSSAEGKKIISDLERKIKPIISKYINEDVEVYCDDFSVFTAYINWNKLNKEKYMKIMINESYGIFESVSFI